MLRIELYITYSVVYSNKLRLAFTELYVLRETNSNTNHKDDQINCTLYRDLDVNWI